MQPWLIPDEDQLQWRIEGLRSWDTSRTLVPFAERTDRDDVACWDLDLGNGSISVIGDFEVAGFEQGETYANFYDWLRAAIEELIEFK